MDMLPVLVAFHTFPWMRVAVGSYLQHFPDDRLLVVDNNPKRHHRTWRPDCDRERAWLARHPRVILLDNPDPKDQPWTDRTHGAGVDLAVDWCRRHGVEVMLHFEPDCLVKGRAWRDNLEEALRRGAWMAGCHRKQHGPLHPTPSAWRVAEVRASFKSQLMGPDRHHPRFRELVDMDNLQSRLTPVNWDLWSCRWDTGHKAWFEVAVHDRAAAVDGTGFRHYWLGSTTRRLPANALVEQFPDLWTYLFGPLSRLEPVPVGDCPYREEVRREGDAETATCRLLQELSEVRDARRVRVRRDACEACCALFPPGPEALNAVVSSLLYQLADDILARGGVPGCSPAAAAALRERAEQTLEVDRPAGQ